MFLGIDCSTQSLKIQVINELKSIEKEVVIVYDEHLPQYKTLNGVIRHEKNGFDHISTPTMLFVEAFELALSKLSSTFDMSKVKAISGSGQQHGSVWWNKGSNELLKQIDGLTSEVSLSEHLKTAFSMQMSPIWMDSSTSIECKEITESEYVGSSKKLAGITGSRAYERFTGPQIKHVYKHDAEIYENTERISLISSFLPSLLTGKYASIDLSDGSGMNILNIYTKAWDPFIADAIAPNLKEKLGKPAKPTDFKFIAKYWCKKYGFSPQCQIYPFSGDNPCSLIGLGLNKSGDIGISLGTSDTLFAVTENPAPNPNEGSLFIHPEDSNNFMMMLCYKNGAITRNFIKDSVHKVDPKWELFNKSISTTPIGRNGSISFYYKEIELTPNVEKSGMIHYDNDSKPASLQTNSLTETDCRGIVESQVLSYKHHSQVLGLDEINSITVTGGGSVNKEILQIIADVFEKSVQTLDDSNTACTGAAIKALNAYHKLNEIEAPEIASKVTQVIEPIKENFPIYRELYDRYRRLEVSAVEFINEQNNS